MPKALRWVLAAVAMLLAGRGGAATYYVAPGGSNSNPGTSASPFQTLQRGVDVSGPGDTIIVKDGTYASGTSINKAGTSAAWITIRAENKWKAVLNCNLNCHSLFSLGSASAYWVIQGFDMSNGRSAGVFSNSGGGKNIRVVGNHIHHIGNVTDTSSIGIMGVYTDTAASGWTIDGNVIHDCGRTGGLTGSHDHGLYLHGANFVVTNNVFYRVFNGWHIQTANTFSGRIMNNTFYQSNLYPGKLGSIVLWEPNSNVIIRNNIFYDSGAVAVYTYALSMSGSCSIDNNIVYRIGGIPSIIDSLPAACVASNNRLTVDPLLVNPTALDFHLQAASPAVDTGSPSLAPTTDHDGAARPQSATYDVGAFEYGGTAPLPPPPAPTGCIVSAASWQNAGFAAQTGGFTVSFDAVPGAGNMDGVAGISNGAAADYAALAVAVRFNNAGTIDARNGAAYGAASALPYISGLTYRFRLVVNLAARTYSAYVKQGANPELLIGSGYAFRTEQAAATALNNLGLFASSGSEQACAVSAVTSDATPPALSAITISAVSQTGATIGWSTSEAADTQVEYGPTTAYGASSPLNSALTTTHGVALSALSAGTLYHYRVKSKDAAGNAAVSGDLTFTTAAAADTTPPVITGVAASGVTQTGAAIAWTTNEASDSQVEYGPTASYGGSTLLNSALVTSHGAALTGLTAGTLYHYRVKSKDAAGNLGTSPDATFTTTPGSVGAGCVSSAGTWQNASIAAQSGTFTVSYDAVPGAGNIDGVSGLSNGPALNYTALAAVVRFNNAGTIDARNGGAYAASASIPYVAGLTYRFRLAVNLSNRTYSAYVKPGSAAEVLIGSGYSFRTEQAAASTVNNVGLFASSGSEQVCAISVGAPAGDTAAPVISGVAASAVSQTGATIGWLTNEASDSQVEYGLTTAYGASTLLNLALVTSHGSSLGGLVPGVLYHYRVKSKDAAGNLATSPDAVFTTAAAPEACASSAGTWVNTPLPPRSGTFIVEFDAIPAATNIDGVMGLSNGPAADYAKLAAIVRFTNAGTIDARNAGAYTAASSIPYAAGLTYRFRLEVSLTARKYSAFVRQGANPERLIGGNYSFRTEQSSLSSINNLGLLSSMGSTKICAATVR